MAHLLAMVTTMAPNQNLEVTLAEMTTVISKMDTTERLKSEMHHR